LFISTTKLLDQSVVYTYPKGIKNEFSQLKNNVLEYFSLCTCFPLKNMYILG